MDKNKAEKKKHQEKKPGSEQPKSKQNFLFIPVQLTLLVPIPLPSGPTELNADVNGIPTVALESMSESQAAEINQSIITSEAHKYAIVAAKSAAQSYIEEIEDGAAYFTPLAGILPEEEI